MITRCGPRLFPSPKLFFGLASRRKIKEKMIDWYFEKSVKIIYLAYPLVLLLFQGIALFFVVRSQYFEKKSNRLENLVEGIDTSRLSDGDQIFILSERILAHNPKAKVELITKALGIGNERLYKIYKARGRDGVKARNDQK